MAGTIPPPHHQYSPWSAPATPQVPPPLAVHGSFDEVRTIFVLGFPPDVKERELQNLLRWWPGYEASQINFKGGQPMGFALFSTAAMALSARDALQNLVFDAETDSVLRAEMAKKNLYVKRGVTGVSTDTASFDQSKRIRTGGDYSPAQYGPSRAFDSSASPAWGSQSYIAPAASYDPYGGYSVPSVQPGAQHVPQPVAPVGYAPVQNTKDNPPCNTLFIGNLGEAASEAELRGLFSSQPGFRQMKVLRQDKSTVCFIEFADINSARSVHNNLQGAVLTSSDRGGMRIQYSRNPFGRKKEIIGQGMQLSDGVAPGVSVIPDVNGL